MVFQISGEQEFSYVFISGILLRWNIWAIPQAYYEKKIVNSTLNYENNSL